MTTQPDMLKAKEHADILDVIDEARSFGVGHFMDLPQIIVCGDQSSGKSSVLNAISNIQFPKQDELCTRFATEVSLRRGPEDNITVSVIPSDDRTEEEKQELRKFARTGIKLEDMERLTSEATAAIGIDFKNKRFANDILKFEVTGPKQPQLTLVDLPGLFQTSSRSQTDQDVAAVRDLVLGYMKGQRSIVLAVVSAKNDVSNQIVTGYARDVDPTGQRTLGIITKPDTLHPGSGSEAAFIQLARNQDIRLRRGWHVLRNRDFDTRFHSQEERDEAEERFFNSGAWKKLSKDDVGIVSLRKRLSALLRDQIVQEFPHLMGEILDQVKDCKKTLKELGAPRLVEAEQRSYLLKASYQFSHMIKAAIEGNYNASVFGSSGSERGRQMRLRAVVQNKLIDFSKLIEQEGHTYHIVSEDEIDGAPQRPGQQVLSHEQYLDKVLEVLRETRGSELPGSYNPAIVGELFHDQSKPWRSLVEDCISEIWHAVRTTIDLILTDLTDESTEPRIKKGIIDPAVERLNARVESRKSVILSPYERGHPITYNPHFAVRIETAESDDQYDTLDERYDEFHEENPGILTDSVSATNDAYVDKLLKHLSSRKAEDADSKACERAVDSMQAYYDIAMRTLVDNLAAIVIEDGLLQRLHDVFSPEKVAELDSQIVAEIAAESEESQNLRKDTKNKLDALEKTLALMRRLDRSYQRQQSGSPARSSTLNLHGKDSTSGGVSNNNASLPTIGVLDSSNNTLTSTPSSTSNSTSNTTSDTTSDTTPNSTLSSTPSNKDSLKALKGKATDTTTSTSKSSWQSASSGTSNSVFSGSFTGSSNDTSSSTFFGGFNGTPNGNSTASSSFNFAGQSSSRASTPTRNSGRKPQAAQTSSFGQQAAVKPESSSMGFGQYSTTLPNTFGSSGFGSPSSKVAAFGSSTPTVQQSSQRFSPQANFGSPAGSRGPDRTPTPNPSQSWNGQEVSKEELRFKEYPTDSERD